MLDLQVRLGGTDGIGIHELGQDERAAVLAALGVTGKRQDAVDMLDAMRFALGLPTPAGGIHALTSDDIGGLLRWQAERHAGHPVRSQWEEVARQQGTGETFFAGSVVDGILIQHQALANVSSTPSKTNRLIGVPEKAFNRVEARLKGLRVGNKNIVNKIEVFGSRAGSRFRGRGPLATSDLDMLVTLDTATLKSRNERWIRQVLREIGTDFNAEAGFELSLYAPENVSNFKKSIEGTNFVEIFSR